MGKTLIYTDETGEKVDLATMEGIELLLNDIYATCEKENACMCVRENLKACAEKCYRNRIDELQYQSKYGGKNS